MKRHAFTLKLKPGCAAEYRRRHDAIWPELIQETRESGVCDFSIFLEESTHTLFLYQVLKKEPSVAERAPSEVALRWRDYMADLIEVHADNAPKAGCLTEVFYMK